MFGSASLPQVGSIPASLDDTNCVAPMHRLSLSQSSTTLPPPVVAGQSGGEISEDELAQLLAPYLEDMASCAKKGHTIHPKSILPNLISTPIAPGCRVNVVSRRKAAPARVRRSPLRSKPLPITLAGKVKHRRSGMNTGKACMKYVLTNVSGGEKVASSTASVVIGKAKRRTSCSALCA